MLKYKKAGMVEMLEESIKQIYRHNAILSTYACQDNEAIYFSEKEPSFLPPFYEDTEAIINSNSYARYMGKPQVYTQNHIYDHIQNRMIHAELVSRVARTLGNFLGLNEHLLEAAGKGHDIGHVPFGHEGEYILDDISRSVGEGYFNHNVESVRNLMFLENHGRGLNVSLQVLDAILCHNSKGLQPVMEPKPKTLEQFMQEYYATYQDKSVLNRIVPMTLEGCIIRISDLVAYLGRDLDDAERYGIFSWDQVPSEITQVLGHSRSELVNTCISDIVNSSFNKPYIAISDKVFLALKSLLKVNTENIYHNYLQPGEKEQMEIMFNTMFKKYVDDLKSNNEKSLIVEYFNSMAPEYQNNNSRERVALDFISGMTTNYFKREYDKELIRTRKL